MKTGILILLVALAFFILSIRFNPNDVAEYFRDRFVSGWDVRTSDSLEIENRHGKFQASKNEAGLWFLADGTVASPNAIGDVLSKTHGELIIKSFHKDENVDPSLYGLDKPTASIKFGRKGMSDIVVFIGKANRASRYLYASKELPPKTVYVLADTSLIEFVDQENFQWEDHKFLKSSLPTLSSIKFELLDQGLSVDAEIQKLPQKSIVTCKFGGKKIETEKGTFESLAHILEKIEYTQIYDRPDAELNLDMPWLKIDLFRNAQPWRTILMSSVEGKETGKIIQHDKGDIATNFVMTTGDLNLPAALMGLCKVN
ncbi:MAG: DUF4340 domain-containing protein [bacterium]